MALLPNLFDNCAESHRTQACSSFRQGNSGQWPPVLKSNRPRSGQNGVQSTAQPALMHIHDLSLMPVAKWVPIIGKYGRGLALDKKAAPYWLLRSNFQATDDRAHGWHPTKGSRQFLLRIIRTRRDREGLWQRVLGVLREACGRRNQPEPACIGIQAFSLRRWR
jgi:hypothetical protein